MWPTGGTVFLLQLPKQHHNEGSNEGVVSVGRGEERVESQGEALNLLVYPRSNPSGSWLEEQNSGDKWPVSLLHGVNTTGVFSCGQSKCNFFENNDEKSDEQ